MLYCNGGWIESIAAFESTNAVVEAIDEHLSKTIKNIEESGGYTAAGASRRSAIAS